VIHLAYRHSYGFPQSQSPSWTLLVQLRGAHDGLLAQMENLDRMALDPQPELGEFTTGRWRIGQASLRRRSIASRAFDFLADRLDGEDLAQLKKVRFADQDMMRRSAAHVGNWTIEAICRDWNGYCRASHTIRAHMKSHMLYEKQWLYPLLERQAGREI
jgi:hypothetical protein